MSTVAESLASAPSLRPRRISVRGVVTWLLGTLWLIVVVGPLYYLLLASFRTMGGYLMSNPWVPNSGLTLSEYSAVFRANLGTYFINTVIVTAVSVALTVVISLGFAFRVIRHATRLPRVFFRVLLVGLAVPIQAIIVPLFLLIDKLHLYDSLLALILCMSATAVPLSVLIMANFVRDIPRELIDAMTVDGGSEWVVFRHLIWPLSKGVLATVGIYDGLNVWNNFLLPLILTQSTSTAVLPLGLTKFQTQFVVQVPMIMAAVALSVVPLVLVYVAMRRYVVAGFSGAGRLE